MAYKPGRMPSKDGSITYYADSVDDVPTTIGSPFHVGDTFICRADGAEGVVTYMLFPSGWWKVG